MAVIYKTTNKINGKAYIGFAKNFTKRKRVHKSQTKNDNISQYLHKSIRKYGWENFEWEIIKCNATLEDEIKLIKEHDTFWENGRGYNLTFGGEGNLGWKMSEETKKKISKKAKGNKYCLGRIMSEETKKKISESKKGKPSWNKGKPSPLRGRKQPKELIEKRISARLKTLQERKTK